MSVRLNQASDTEGTLPLLEQITLPEFVSQLIQLSDQDRDDLQQHSSEECDAEVNRLVQLVQDPSRGTLTVQEIVGRLFMLQHRQADLGMKALQVEIKALSRSNERLNSEVQDLRLDLKRASDALEERNSKLEKGEPSQGAATSLLFGGNAQEFPTSRPNPQTRASFVGLLHDHSKGGGDSASEDETEYYGNGARDSRRSLSRRLDAHSRHESRGRSTERRRPTRDSLSRSPSEGRFKGDESHPRSLTSREREQEVNFAASPPLSGGRSMSRGRKSVHYDSASPPRRSRDESRHESISPPRRRSDMRRRDSTSPFSRNLSVSRRHSASRSQSRADTYRDTYSSRRQYTLSPPRHNRQERLKLIWKTASRPVRAFIESQPPLVRDSFSRLSRALIEEFSPFTDETSATISALQIKHRRSEAPKEFYNRRLWVDACNLHITSYTQDQAPITQRAWLEVAFQEMKILHPVYISRFDTESFLIGQDLLDRLTPLIDCRRGQLWAQVVAAKSIEMETDARNLCIQANGVAVPEVIVALWSEKSAVRQDLCDIICQNDANLPFVQKSHRLLSAELPQAPVKSIGVCALTLQIGGREFVHYVSVAPLLSHSFYIGADILVRLGAQLDMINQVVWSQANIRRNKLTAQPEQMCSGQTVPIACQVASEFDVVIPSRATGVPLRLMILRGQELDSTQTFFQPSPHLFELNLMVCGSPLLEVTNRSVYLLVQNLTHRAIQVTARKPLGYLIDSSYHDFELTIPIIGELPNSLREFGNGEGVYLTHPTNMIAIFPQEPIQSSTVCHVDLGDKVGMVLHTSTMTPNASSSGDAGTLLLEEPYLDFESEVQQQLSKADALKGDVQRQELRGLFYDFKHLFSRDSYDCGVTDLHTVRIPTDPGAPPTFVRQYRIPLAAFESI
ncbi:hypothetical protein SKAU_G00411500 [Synaphobranchus kaupii]|uniref:Uncharacterized protein n=1 Tax=Synaphobranchus kaupii TaxID=118154 RepID=A0A9Q1E7W5_SYNKA|nr:hypothetical protein SKAU_G00411500 [Synaphobranchus kaupii]